MNRTIQHPALDDLSAASPPGRFLAGAGHTILVTGAGTGCSFLGENVLTRWSGDRIEDPDGFHFYIRDVESGDFWSIGHQPVQRIAEKYNVRWEPGVFELIRVDQSIESRMEVCVSPDSGTEIRRITLINHSSKPRSLEITSYAELVLARQTDYMAHPAFAKLFVQTEFLEAHNALLASRRSRSGAENHPWLYHALSGEGDLQWETDRSRFLGRGRSTLAPQALTSTRPLSGTTGAVLDPVISFRRTVTLDPAARTAFHFVLGAAPTRKEAVARIESMSRVSDWDELFDRARTDASDEKQRFGLSTEQAESLHALAAALLYRHPSLRANREILRNCRGSLNVLHRYGLSPNRPFCLLHAENPAGALLVPECVRAHRYWRALGLSIELLIIGDNPSKLPPGALPDEEHCLHQLTRGDIAEDHRALIDAAADFVVTDSMPDLTSSLSAGGEKRATLRATTDEPIVREEPPDVRTPAEDLRFFNGHGGFTKEGNEYVIRLRHDGAAGLRRPPLPWVNIIANDRIGFLVSETGAGSTWSRNSREHRLTPWSNDPVCDPHEEAFYIRDEETGEFWSPLPGPTPAGADYEMRHRFGESLCLHESHGLEQKVSLFVPLEDPVKIVRLTLTNRSSRSRQLSLVSYRRLVLGGLPEECGRFLLTKIESDPRSLLAENRLAGEFASGITFSAVTPPAETRSIHLSTDRCGFIGRNGNPARPAALRSPGPIEEGEGESPDPCFAEQVVLELKPGESTECSFLFGESDDRTAVRELIARYRKKGEVERALAEVRESWRSLFSRFQIETPVPALDLMVNGWLPYQTIACRMRGRTAFYQSGGAFGFRDQLQDASSLVYLSPEMTRAQIVLHAAHQFIEGDVLHWWHPPHGGGIRTRFADDRLWLPAITVFYAQTTGDLSVLDESAPFLAARSLAKDEDEAYVVPRDSGISADLYEHCCRAIDLSLATGGHGLPLFGTGDWNDGMNRVGREGRGESVWMGFFIVHVLDGFIPFCEERADRSRAERYSAARARLHRTLNDAGWDGEWYKRGFYDNGAPLGSRESSECRIDALAQAWAVISGVAPPERAEQAIDAVEQYLVSETDGLIRLLTPAFDKTAQDPGYIKGYLPGVRENGGQYTHAALWVIRAIAELGRNNRAAKLLEMLSPVSRAIDSQQVGTYKVEPYVVAADIYGEPPHVGRGGWTWYTGSSAWMYRVTIESVLGISLQGGDTLAIKPCIPDDWPRYSVAYRVPGGETRYTITVENPRRSAGPVMEATVDGAPVPIEEGAARIPIGRDDGKHIVHLILGQRE